MRENRETSSGFQRLRQMHPDDLNRGDRVATREGEIFQVESIVTRGKRILGCQLNPVSGTDKNGWGGKINTDIKSLRSLGPDSSILIRKLEKRG